MPKIESINPYGSIQEVPREPGQLEKWFGRASVAFLLVLYCLSFFYKWPKLAFLFCSPTTIPFGYFFIRDAHNLGKPWMRKVVAEVVALHTLVLVGIALLLVMLPIVATHFWLGTVATAVVVAESIVVATLLHFQRPREPQSRREL